MPHLVDLLILFVVGAAIYTGIRRGLFFVLFDILRLLVGIILGFAAYSSFHSLFRSYLAGFVALVSASLSVVVLVPMVLRLLRANPAWGKTATARLAASLGGLGIGFLAVAAFVPALDRPYAARTAVARSYLAQPFLDAEPALYYVADAINLDFPALGARPIGFEDEGRPGKAVMANRVNFSRLNGSTCIECGARVRFDGYLRRGATVSPRFTCPRCGRRSDGCQSFEGFHRMYRSCPVDMARTGPIDCGVWNNRRPVYPRGVCPVCGRSMHRVTPAGIAAAATSRPVLNR